MSRRDIEAGKSYVSLYVRNSLLVRGLRASSRHVANFGRKLTALGAGMAGVGASIVTPVLAATKQFAEAGSLLKRTSIQTGESVENLSALKFAASQTGVEFDDLVGSIEESNIRLGEAVRDGTGPLHDTLKMLGVDMQELNELTPTDRFKELSKILKGIEDPSLRGFLADEMFGGDAFKILPLLKGDMDGLIDKAKELGLVMSDEEATAASALSKTFGVLRLQVDSVVNAVGAAFAPTLLEAGRVVSDVITNIRDWVKQNAGLLVTIGKIGAALLAAGTVIGGIGGVVTTVGIALGGLAAAFTAVAGVISTVVTVISTVGAPVIVVIGLIAALYTALMVAGGAWLYYSGIVGRVVSFIREQITALLDYAKPVIDGLKNALGAGDLSAAATIAWKGAEVAAREGVAVILESIGTLAPRSRVILTGVITGVKVAISAVGPTIARAGELVITGLQKMVVGFSTFIGNVLKNSIKMLGEFRNSAIRVSQGILNFVGDTVGADALGYMSGSLNAIDADATAKVTKVQAGINETATGTANEALAGMQTLRDGSFANSIEKGAIKAFDGIVHTGEETAKEQRRLANEAREAIKNTRIKDATLFGDDGLGKRDGERPKMPAAETLAGFSARVLGLQAMPAMNAEQRVEKHAAKSAEELKEIRVTMAAIAASLVMT